ncbi:MAG: hypothetical protein IPM49_15145 [Flavobacteriales bacterium]|nr:hypothetical protein [Flavobacteriales bacterium]
MRTVQTLTASLVAIATHAQCVQSDLGFDPLQRNARTSEVAFLSSGLVTVGMPMLPNGVEFSRGVNVSRIDAAGTMLWFKHLLPTNPDISMVSAQVAATLDGGVVVCGDLDHGTPIPRYHNQYLVKLDASGQVQWSRIYMLLDTTNALGGFDFRGHRAVEIAALAAGGYAWQFRNERQLHHVTLDPNGMPVSCRMYVDHDLIHQRGVSAIHPDGSWFHGYFGDSVLFSAGAFGYFIADASGAVQVARRAQAPYASGYVTDALALSNGDHLLCGVSATGALFRIDAAGQLLWRRESWWPEEAVELPDGTILGKHASRLLQFTSDGYSMNSW